MKSEKFLLFVALVGFAVADAADNVPSWMASLNEEFQKLSAEIASTKSGFQKLSAEIASTKSEVQALKNSQITCESAEKQFTMHVNHENDGVENHVIQFSRSFPKQRQLVYSLVKLLDTSTTATAKKPITFDIDCRSVDAKSFKLEFQLYSEGLAANAAVTVLIRYMVCGN